MPFSPAAERQYIHTRQVTCHGFRRTDGLWDIEGHLADVKSYPFASEHRGLIDPGDPVHDMSVRLTVDDSLTVQAIEVYTVKSPFHRCGDITGLFQQLIGLSIGAGWTRAVRERLGGPRGCAHLVELLGPVATTAFQTIYPILARERADRDRAIVEGGGGGGGTERPALLDMCHIFASNGTFVRSHWPEHYTGERKTDE